MGRHVITPPPKTAIKPQFKVTCLVIGKMADQGGPGWLTAWKKRATGVVVK